MWQKVGERIMVENREILEKCKFTVLLETKQ